LLEREILDGPEIDRIIKGETLPPYDKILADALKNGTPKSDNGKLSKDSLNNDTLNKDTLTNGKVNNDTMSKENPDDETHTKSSDQQTGDETKK